MRACVPAILILPLSGCILLLAGCRSQSKIDPQQPEIAAYVKLVMPQKIAIQKYLTKPVSYAGDGNPDGLEVIVDALDSFGDPVKVLGDFVFELHERRPASGDEVGASLARWNVSVTPESLPDYWDSLSRKYRFPLKLDRGPLAPQQYILVARLTFPTNDKYSDQYEFAFEGGRAPIVLR